MEVVPVSSGGAVQLPFQRRNVQEWSRLDRLTGMLEHARVETDQWAANTVNSKRKYGKVVDSRARNLADGSIQQSQRKQLEVFQAQVPGASFQVIRTQSVTSTSSSSTSGKWQGTNAQAQHFDNLQLSVHPLDLGLQKNKANVGRSGSIRTRRPPSRPRSIISKLDNSISEEKLADELDHKNTQNIDSGLSQVSRICHQFHETAKKGAYGKPSSLFGLPKTSFDDDLEIEVTPSRIQHFDNSSTDEDENGIHIEEILNDSHPSVPQQNTSSEGIPALNGDIHKRIYRRKSSSTEDLKNLSLDEEEKNDYGILGTGLKRTSQTRRSLQLPLKVSQENVNVPLPKTGIVNSLRELEDKRVRDVSTLKGYEALESVFRRGANIAESVNKSMMCNKDDSENSSPDSLANHLRNENMNRKLFCNVDKDGFGRISNNVPSSSNKRHSFVTVESLKEVRGRLRRLGSPPLDDVSVKVNLKGTSCSNDELDDGIVTEELEKHTLSNESVETTAPTTRVRSYVFGMESQSNDSSLNGRRPILGTGSLESRTSSKSNGSGNSRSEEWYSRRKSYGFEPVHSHNADDHSNSIKFEERSKVESSTDSGICRSSETVAVPIRARSLTNKGEENDFSRRQITNNYVHANENTSKISQNIHIKNMKDDSDSGQNLPETLDRRVDESPLQKGRKTVVTLGKEFSPKNLEFNDDHSIVVQNSVLKHDSLISGNLVGRNEESRSAQFIRSPVNSKFKGPCSLSEPITVTIPVVPDDKAQVSTVESKRLFFRQLSEGTSLSIESSQKKGTLLNSSAHKETSPSVSLLRRNSQVNFKEQTWNSGDNVRTNDNEMKRHSIAVDESKYVREGLNNFIPTNENSKYNFEKEFANVSTSELVKRFAAMHSLKQSNKENNSKSGISVSFIQNNDALLNHDENSDELQQNGKKHKKVEFCKTEVHFAAESGRFNIVETDEKPPPSNMFRRRRRSTSSSVPSSPTLDPNKNNLPEVRFGDSPYEKKLLGGDESSDQEKTKQPDSKLQNTSFGVTKPDVTRSMPLALSKFQDDAEKEDQIYTQANATIIAEDQQDSINLKTEEHVSAPLVQNEPVPRSILKNNRKPRPFLLGECVDLNTDSGRRQGEEQEEKWGIRLRPVQSRTDTCTSPMWRSTVTLQNTVFDSSKTEQPTSKEESQSFNSSSDASELQKRLKSLRPSSQRNSVNGASISESYKSPKHSPLVAKRLTAENELSGMQVKISTSSPESHQSSLWSVADRIKQVEDFKKSMTEIKGYSTRINFGSGETTVVESRSLDESPESSHKQPKPSSSPLSSSFHQSDRPKPIWLRREERKQDSVILPDTKKQTSSKKGLMVRIGNSDTNRDVEKDNKKTTMITIELTPSPQHEDNNNVRLVHGKKRAKPEDVVKTEEVLLSPSLIMKTILKPPTIQSQILCEKKDTTSSVVGARKMQAVPDLPDLQETEVSDKSLKPKNFKESSEMKMQRKEDSKVVSNLRQTLGTESNTIPSQLAALKEMYYSGNQSDDSERADEEVRSYMSGGGDEDNTDINEEDSSSVVSGSWSRMRAYRNIQHHFRKFSTGTEPQSRGVKMRSSLTSINDLKKCQEKFNKGHPRLEANTDEPQQRSVATALLPSYDQNRLRTVETLISTRNGQPKITSISLRYEGDQDMDSFRQQDSVHMKDDNASKEDRRLQSNQTDDSNNITASFSYPSQTSLLDRSRCSSKDKHNSELYLKHDISQDFNKSEGMSPQSTVSSMHCGSQHLTSSKEKRLSKVDYVPPEEHSTSRKNNLQNIDKDNSSSIKDRYHTKQKFLSSTSDRKHSFRESQSKSENDESFISSDRQGINYSPPKNSTTSVNYSHQSQKERKVSTTNLHQNLNSANNECLSDGLHPLKSPSTTLNQSSSLIIENHKQIPAINISKNSNEVHSKFSNQNIENSKESDSENMLVRNAQKTKLNVCKVERGSTTNVPQSRSTSRGRSESPTKTTTSLSSSKLKNSTLNKIHTDSCDMHIYENRNIESENAESKTVRQFKRDGTETDSTILEELTRAADQILQAVNGYTDEESAKASSDDDDNGGRRGKSRLSIQMKRSSGNLGTISELPVNKYKDISQRTKASQDVQKSNNNVRRTQRLSKTRLNQNSSTSSIESFTREVRKCSASSTKKDQSSSAEDRAKRKATNLSANPALKPGSRTARLLQRASSRELLLQTHASSSEDVMSGTEVESSRKPRAPRRNRINNVNTSKTASSVSAASSSKNPTSTPQPVQNNSSPAAARLQKKDANATSSSRERHPSSAMKQKKSAGDQNKTHSTRLRELRRTTQDGENHRKHSRQEAVERVRYTEREGKEKSMVAGSSFTPLPSGREKSEQDALEPRSIGVSSRSAVVKASTSHVVKKKSSSSRSERGVLQMKSSK